MFLSVDQVTDKRLADTRYKLNDRVNDVNYWRKEVVAETEKLEKEIRDVDLLKQRIDREIAELDAPLRVSLENTGVRRLKKSDNAVLYLDGVDYELTKVICLLLIFRSFKRHSGSEIGHFSTRLLHFTGTRHDKECARSLQNYGSRSSSTEWVRRV